MNNNDMKENNLLKIVKKIMRFIRKYKNIICLGVGVVILALVITIFSSFLGSKADENLALIFDPEKPIVIEDNGKYGYINTKGNVIIEPSYISASEFYSDYAAVTIENEDGTKTDQIIDKKGNVVIKLDVNQEAAYQKDCGVWLIDNKLYDTEMKLIYEEESFVIYVSDGYFAYMSNDGQESGILDTKGKKIFTWEEDYISVDVSKTNHKDKGIYAVVSNYEEKETIVNLKSGDIIYTLDDPKNLYLQGEDDNVFRVINRSDSYKTDKWLYVKDNKVVYETTEAIYDITLVDYEGQILMINYGSDYKDLGKDERYAYYNIEDKKLSNEKPESANEELSDINAQMKTTHGYSIYSCEEQKGILKDEKEVVKCEYNDIDFLNVSLYEYILGTKRQELVLLEASDKTILYNLKKDKEIASFASTSVTDNANSTFLTVTLFEENGYTKRGYIIYNLLSGESLEFSKEDQITVNSNNIVVTNDKKTVYYNSELKNIFEIEVK